MKDDTATFSSIKKRVHDFIKVRDWRQFHTPKNLSIAIALEAAELMEYFTWLDGPESEKKMQGAEREEIEHEIADIVFAIFALCSHYNVDLSAAMEKKIKIIEERYPVEKAKGRHDKYTAYMEQRKKSKDQG